MTHEWDDTGERCLKCGDKDWFASAICDGDNDQKKELTLEFIRHTDRYIEDGRHHIDCKKGLWAVNGANEFDVYREAIHYFKQYYSDGEYSEGSPIAENIIENFKSAIGNTRVIIVKDNGE